MRKRVVLGSLAVFFFFCCCCPAWGAHKQMSADEYFDQASLQYLYGDYGEALKSLKLALRLDPNLKAAEKLRNTILRQMALRKEQASEEAVPEKPKLPVTVNMYYLAMLGSVASGLIAFILLILSVKWLFGRRESKKGPGRCFNCKAKISPNLDTCPHCGAWVGMKMQTIITKEQKLWFDKLGWSKNPFTLDIQPELFTGYKPQVKQVLEKVASQSGHILITGPLGAGKTTLLRWLANRLSDNSLAIYIPRPPQDFDQIIKLLVREMGFSNKKAAEYDIYHLNALREKSGKRLILLLDEAHEFSVEVERPLRTLGDLDKVNLILAGLPETVDKLKDEIRPLYERLVLQVTLQHLEFADMVELIKVRVEHVGGRGTHPFTGEALQKVFALSNGNPRVVLKICDAAVTRAINQDEDKISAALLEDLKVG